MMIYKAKTIDDKIIDLGKPLEVTMNQAEDIPADDLELKFLCSGKVRELKELYVIKNNENIFSGIVDTQRVSIDDSGIFLSLVSRSKVALLLDNEAIPQTYYVPSLLNIFNRHIKPYGFDFIIGDMKSFSNEFTISKGMSEWEVLENFCADYLKVYPRVSYDGTINATGKVTGDNIFFSNVKSGIRYREIYEKINRYEIYSEVNVKATSVDSYSTIVKNDDVINRGISRRRLLNVVDNMKTPALCGELLISKSIKNSYSICLNCPGNLNIHIGDKASLYDPILLNIDNLVVSEIKYTLNKRGENTKVILKKEA